MIVGVHTPEFAFEHVPSNVRARGQAARRPLPGRARQRVRDLDGVREPVLAGEVPDRPQRARPLRPLRRGRATTSPSRTSGALLGEKPARARLREAARPDPVRAADAGVVPRLRAARPLHRLEAPPGQGGDVHVPAGARPETTSPTRGRWTVERAAHRRRPGRARCGCTSTRARSTSSSAARAACRCCVDGKPAKTVARDRGPALHARRRRLELRDATLELRFTPGRRAPTPSRSASGSLVLGAGAGAAAVLSSSRSRRKRDSSAASVSPDGMSFSSSSSTRRSSSST